MRLVTMFILFTGLPALVSCQSEHQQREAALAELPTPLAHDPTDEFQLARWWSNGTQLLRLDESNYYALYRGLDRQARPAQRGRWSQQSYAALILEPYNTRDHQRTRVTIDRVNDELTLIIPKFKPFRAIELPPATTQAAVP